jgi:CO/xanthine dehydrogenase FAD-binding subunit
MTSSVLFLQPHTLEEAYQHLQDHPQAVILAGGTDLMVAWHGEGPPERPVIDITQVRALHGIERTAKGMRLGSTTTWQELLESPIVRDVAPLLALAAADMGAPPIRNRATLGGNIINASPTADSLPPLMVHEAVLVIGGAEGTRTAPLCSFYRGYKEFDLREGELLLGIEVPRLAAPAPALFWRAVGTRRAQAITRLSLAGAADVDERGVVRWIRLAAGAVAPVVLRLRGTEGLLAAQRIDRGLCERALETASAEISPIDDLRGSAEYRRHVVGNLVERFLKTLMAADQR